MAKTNEIATMTEQVNLANPKDIRAFANNLKDLIVNNGLYTNLKGKNYVNVEGWQIAGAFTGTLPVVEVVENLSEGNYFKYRAEVSLRDENNNKVGYGVAICTNREPGKQNFAEYAVASMAQTRAVGKAYRMKIGWLLKVAGYETTPAEEMVPEAEVVVKPPIVDDPKSAKPSIRDISYAKDRLEMAKDMNELKSVFVSLSEDIRNNKEIVACKDAMKIKLEKGSNEQN